MNFVDIETKSTELDARHSRTGTYQTTDYFIDIKTGQEVFAISYWPDSEKSCEHADKARFDWLKRNGYKVRFDLRHITEELEHGII